MVNFFQKNIFQKKSPNFFQWSSSSFYISNKKIVFSPKMSSILWDDWCLQNSPNQKNYGERLDSNSFIIIIMKIIWWFDKNSPIESILIQFITIFIRCEQQNHQGIKLNPNLQMEKLELSMIFKRFFATWNEDDYSTS